MITLKNPILLVCILLLACSCNSDDYTHNPVNPPIGSTALFDLTQVPEIELRFSLAEWNALLTNYDLNPRNEKKVVARFSYKNGNDVVVLDSIGLKLRGNTSRRRPEGTAGELHNPISPNWNHCHFGIDFNKNRPQQNFKGLKKLNLKWFKDDAAYVREIYSYDLFRRFGVWTAPRASYCKLKIMVAGDPAPAYYGIYMMLESVDEEFIAKRGSQWGTSPGFMWKGSHIGSAKADFASTASMGIEDVKMNPLNSIYYAYDLKTREEELETAKSGLITFINDLNSKTGAEFESWISQQMDVDLFLKTYSVNVMVGMWDDYWVNGNNFYFYFASDNRAYFIPYDYDNTLGTSQILQNSGTQNPLTWGNMSARPLITKILAVPQYREKYKQYINELCDSNNDLFASSKSKSRIAAWQMLIAPHVSNDTGEDMQISDIPAAWGNAPFYRLSSGNAMGGENGEANWFSSRIQSIPW